MTPQDSYAIYCALFDDKDDTVEDLKLDGDDHHDDDDVSLIQVDHKNGAEDNEASRCVTLKYAIYTHAHMS